MCVYRNGQVSCDIYNDGITLACCSTKTAFNYTFFKIILSLKKRIPITLSVNKKFTVTIVIIALKITP